MKKAYYYVYDPNDEAIGLVQNAWSIQWRPKYDETGDFEIYLRFSEGDLDLYKLGNRILCTEDNTIGFITQVYIRGDDIEIRGKMDNLADRINTVTMHLTKLADLMTLIERNKRGLNVNPSVKNAPDIPIDVETTWDDLRTTVSSQCLEHGAGYRMVKKDNRMNVIELYQGRRNEDAVFSETLGNLLACEWLQSEELYKNYAYVAGEGGGANRTIEQVDQTKGSPRKELYVDARELQRIWTDEDGTEHQYTEAQYRNLLKQKGVQALQEHLRETTFEINSNLYSETFVYGQDYSLGDILLVSSKKYHLKKYFRLVGINRVQQEGNQLYGIFRVLDE